MRATEAFAAVARTCSTSQRKQSDLVEQIVKVLLLGADLDRVGVAAVIARDLVVVAAEHRVGTDALDAFAKVGVRRGLLGLPFGGRVRRVLPDVNLGLQRRRQPPPEVGGVADRAARPVGIGLKRPGQLQLQMLERVNIRHRRVELNAVNLHAASRSDDVPGLLTAGIATPA